MGEAEVGHFCNRALLSEEDVPVCEDQDTCSFSAWAPIMTTLGIPGRQIPVDYFVLLQELHPTAHLSRVSLKAFNGEKNLGAIFT